MGARRTYLVASGLSALAVLLFGGIAVMLLRPPESAEGSMLRPQDAALVALGGQVYAEHCAACHGASLEGAEASPHDGTGHTWQHPDRVLFEMTKFGTSDSLCFAPRDSDMPIFQNSLSDREIIAALSFIKSRWPEEIQRQHDQINRFYAATAGSI